MFTNHFLTVKNEILKWKHSNSLLISTDTNSNTNTVIYYTHFDILKFILDWYLAPLVRRRGVFGRVTAFHADGPVRFPAGSGILIPTLDLEWGPLSLMRTTE